MNQYTEITGSWRGKRAVCYAEPGDWDAWFAEHEARAFVCYHSRFITRDENAGGVSFVKVLLGLGDNIHTFWNALKWRFRPSRALHVLRISQAMEAEGICCAPVLMAARRRSWWPWGWPTDVLVTACAPGEALAALVRKYPSGTPERLQALKLATAELARFHALGFIHGDCAFGNFMVDLEASRVCFIDNDRTRRALWGAAGSHAIRRNLVQFLFQMHWQKLMGEEEIRQVLKMYGVAAGWPQARLEQEQERILRKLRSRLRDFVSASERRVLTNKTGG